MKGARKYKKENSVEEENYALPGKPMSIETFRKRIAASENSPSLTLEEFKKEVERWKKGQPSLVAEPSIPYGFNWLNPSRPATDLEIDEMINECKNSPLLSAEEARKLTHERIALWRKLGM